MFFPFIYSCTRLRDETISVTPQYVKSLGRLLQTPTPCCSNSQHWQRGRHQTGRSTRLLRTSSEPTTRWIKAGVGLNVKGYGGMALSTPPVRPSLNSYHGISCWLAWYASFCLFFPLFFSPSSSGMRNYTICKQNAEFHHHPLFVCITFFGGKRLSPSALREQSGVASVATVKRPFSGSIFFTHPSFVVCALIVVVCVFSDAIVSQECQNTFRMKSKSLDKNGLTETIFPTPTCIY